MFDLDDDCVSDMAGGTFRCVRLPASISFVLRVYSVLSMRIGYNIVEHLV